VLDRILLTNDDGIEAPGLGVLEEIARDVAREVWVVAPEHDQSGVLHAVSTTRLLSGKNDALPSGAHAIAAGAVGTFPRRPGGR